MKKYIGFLIMLIMIFCMSSVSFAADENAQAILNRMVSIMYNNELKEFSDVNGVKVYPLTYQGTTYLPIRAISALFSIPVEWVGETRTVLLGTGDVSSSTVKTIDNFIPGSNEEITLLLSSSIQIKYNNEVQKFTDVNGTQVFPLLYNDTTYLPVRAISNMYGADVEWNGATNRITLLKGDKVANITDVIIKVAEDKLYAEIKSDAPIENYTNYLLAEGTIAAEPHLNMRAETNTSSEILAKIPDEEKISINKVIKDQNLKVWYEVQYDNKKGYVSADYVNVASARFFVDLDNTNFSISTESKEIKYKTIDSIRFGKQGENVNRIVLDLNKLTDFCVAQAADKCTTYMVLDDEFKVSEEAIKDYVLIASAGGQVFLPETEKPNDEVVPTPDVPSGETNVEQEENISGDDSSSKDDAEDEKVLTKEELAKLAKVTAVTYSSTTDKIKINISKKGMDYQKFMLENPTRLVIDIPDTLLDIDGVTEITPKNKNIKQIRFAQNELDKVRVVIELNNAADYSIKEKTYGLEVSIEEPEYRNVEYKEYDDYAELILKNTKKSYFDTTETSRTNKYAISYASSRFDSGKADLEIDDEFIETITIRTNKITLKATGKMDYKMKQVGDDVVITIKEKDINELDGDGKFIVLLDAGHGGKDPGACYQGGKVVEHQEKTYTLAVMLKVLELLEDEDDIEVRTSRTRDVYIDREGRIEYVLDNEDANLFVSVHINSSSSNKPSGTLVCYYNKEDEKEDYGITSKELAMIVKNNLVDALEIPDMGLMNRKDIWVLEQNDSGNISEITGEDRPVTNIPAILCELCFISNESDFEKLQTEDFQDAAAEAIYEGILEAKEQMGK